MSYKADIEAAGGLLQQGNYKRAAKAALSAARKSPGSAVAFNIAGIATSASGRPREAVALFQKALKAQPGFSDAEKNLAQTLILIGRADAALSLLVKLTGKLPQDWQVWSLKAQAERGLGREKDALVSLSKAIEQAPQVTSNYHLRSAIFISMGRLRDAIEDLQTVLTLDPGDVNALTNLSLPLARQMQTQGALEVVQKAVERAPGDLAARFRLASQLVEMGLVEEAVIEYQSILAKDRSHPAALERCAALLPKDAAVQLEPDIRTALAKAAKGTEDRASLFYALATVQSAGGDPVQAEKSLGAANREMAKRLPYDAQGDARVTKAILSRFPLKEALPPPADQGFTPIFILGLPRSGTTLAETILGLHPDVMPLGERGTLGFLLRDIIEQDLPLTAQDAAILRAEDRRLLPDLPKGTRAYVDKMPENYRLVGFLKALYPDARIINMRRDPRDVALSMWKAHFSGTVLSYTYDWAWMAAKFNLYAESMARWKALYPDQIHDLRYEDLVDDVEGEGQRLAAVCGLDWHSAMARPDLSTAQVLTASATQVRRPVHGGSVGNWRRAPDLVAPFVADLDGDLWSDYLS